MGPIASYGRMIADTGRTDAYHEALRRTIQTDSVVVDIGTGMGILALLACQLGARRVYAIESNQEAIHIGQKIAADNGYGERIEFIHALSFDVTLPEPADLIVWDLNGVLPLFRRHVPAIVDARRRLLAPGGTLIPQAETLWGAIVEAPDLHRTTVGLWADRPYGFDMHAAHEVVVNRWVKAQIAPGQVLTEPLILAELDFATIEQPDLVMEAVWTVRRTAAAHGLAVWFDALLAPGIEFGNAPGRPETVYGQAFFPWPVAVLLETGDRVAVTLGAHLLGDEYVWTWKTTVRRATDSGHILVRFDQSTYFGTWLSQPKPGS